MIERPPSAELRHDQKDTDSLPPYEVLDPILEAFIEEDLSVDQIAARGFDRATVGRILDLVKRNEYKRRQAPPGVRVSGRAFGRDWRYPITSGYQGALSASRASSEQLPPGFLRRLDELCVGRVILVVDLLGIGREIRHVELA